MARDRRTLYLGSDYLPTTAKRSLMKTFRIESSRKIYRHRWHSLTSPKMTCHQSWPTFALVLTTGISRPGYYDSLPMNAIALLQFSLHTAAKRILLYPCPSLQGLATAHKMKSSFFLWPSNPCMIWLPSPLLLFGSALSLTYPAQPHWLLLVP